MSTKFLSITANQEPFPIGLDAQNRNMLSVNFTAVAQSPISSWVMCVVKVLSNAGLGTFGTDIFAGAAVSIPDSGDGPFIFVNDTGGAAPVRQHGSTIHYKRLSVQLIIHATDYAVAEAHAAAAHAALDGVWNTTVAA